MHWQLKVLRHYNVSANLASVLMDAPSAPISVTSRAIVAFSPPSLPNHRLPHCALTPDARFGLLGVVPPARIHPRALLAQPLVQVGEHCTCLEQAHTSNMHTYSDITGDANLPRSRMTACVPRQTRRVADEAALVLARPRPQLPPLRLETTLALYRSSRLEIRGLRTSTALVLYAPRLVAVYGPSTSQALVPFEHGALDMDASDSCTAMVIYRPQLVQNIGLCSSYAMVVYQPPLLNYGLQASTAMVTSDMGMLVVYVPPTPALLGMSQLVPYTRRVITDSPALAAEGLALHAPTTDLLVRRDSNLLPGICQHVSHFAHLVLNAPACQPTLNPSPLIVHAPQSPRTTCAAVLALGAAMGRPYDLDGSHLYLLHPLTSRRLDVALPPNIGERGKPLDPYQLSARIYRCV